MPRSLLILTALAAVVGCDVIDDRHDIGTVATPYCEGVETAITADEVTAIGLTGADLTDNLPDSASGLVEWSGGDTTGLTWGFAAEAGSLRYVENTVVYPPAEPGQAVADIGVDCPSYIAIDGTLSLQSDDGQLDEAIALTISLDEYSVESLTAVFYAELTTLDGALQLSDYVDDSSYDEVRLFLFGEITDGALTADLSAQGEGSSGDAVFVESISLGTIIGEGE